MPLPTELELAGLKTTAMMIVQLLQSDSTVDTPLGPLPGIAQRVRQLVDARLPDLIAPLAAAHAEALQQALQQALQRAEADALAQRTRDAETHAQALASAQQAHAQALAQQAEQHAQALQDLQARAAQQAEAHAQALAEQAQRHRAEVEALQQQLATQVQATVQQPVAARRADVLRGVGTGYVTPPDLAHYLDVQARRLTGA